MKHCTIRVILFLILIFPITDTFGQVEIGFYGGANTLHLSGDQLAYSIYKPGPGWNAGAIINLNITDDIQISLRPGLSVNHARLQTIDTLKFYFITKLEYRDSIYLQMNYARLPVLIRVLSDNHRFLFTTGFEFIYLFNTIADNGVDKFSIQHDFSKFNIAAQFGIGYIIPFKNTNFSIEAHYSQTLNNLSGSDPENSFFPRIKVSGFHLNLTWTIPVSNKKQPKL